MKKLKRAGIVILVLLTLAACAGFIFRGRLIARFVPTVEQMGDIQIRIKNDTSYLSARLIVTNRLFLRIEIDTLRYKVGLFGKTYLQSEKSLGIKLPAYGSDTVEFSLKVPHAAIMKDLKAERKKEDSAAYALDISLQYSTLFGKSEVPIKRSAKLKIPQPPEIKIGHIKWKKVRLRTIHAIAEIKITNHSAISLSIKNIRYSMDITKQGSLQGSYKKEIVIRPRGSTSFELPIEMNINNMGKTLLKILVDKDTYDYVLSIEAMLESTDPVKETFHLDLTKSGKIELKK
jgi:LEA14-like dessication related protein